MDDSDNIGTYMVDEMMVCEMLLVIHICAANHCNYWILPNQMPKKCHWENLTALQQTVFDDLFNSMNISTRSGFPCTCKTIDRGVKLDWKGYKVVDIVADDKSSIEFMLSKACGGNMLQHAPTSKNHEFAIFTLHTLE